MRFKALRLVLAVVLNVVLPATLAWTCVWIASSHKVDGRPHSLVEEPDKYGPVTLRLKLPGTAGEIPEPLLVIGRPGRAALVYIRLLKQARAKVGVEFWGQAAFESSDFGLPAADAVIEVTCWLPGFFPREGDLYWGQLSPRIQAIRRSGYQIAVNGVVRLSGPVSYEQPKHEPFYFGKNPLGGSLVSDRFTGTMISMRQPD